MFPNLEAEQSRFRMTNQQVADMLQISRATYEAKKRNGKFNRAEIVALCQHFYVNLNIYFLFNNKCKLVN